MRDISKKNSFLLWLPYIVLNKKQFISFIVCVLIMIPLSLILLGFIPFIIQTINSTPTNLTWEKIFGHELTKLIKPIFTGTDLYNGITIHFQQHYLVYFIFAVLLIYSFLNFLSDFLIRDLGEVISHYLRNQIFQKYLKLDYKEAKTFDAGFLSSMVGEDSKEVSQTFARLSSSLIKDGTTSLIFLTWLILLDFRLFILFITILTPAAIVLRATGKTLKRLSRQGLQSENELLNAILERMRGWQTIKVFHSKQFELANFEKINNKIFNIWRRATRAKALGSPLVEWLGIIAAALVAVVALRRITGNELSSQVLISFIVTLGFLLDKANTMVGQLNSSRKGTESLRRIVAFLNSPLLLKESVDLHYDHTKEILPTNLNSISMNTLAISPDGKNILAENLSGHFKKGSITAIIGPSGIGKSTFLNILLGLQKPDKGEFLINDKTATEDIFLKLSDKIGVIPQDPILFQGTILDNIFYPHKINEPTENDLKKAKNALKMAQLNSNFYSEIYSLSGGEKQRLMFARLFYNMPEFIIIDEGTSALDTTNEIKILENLKTQLKDSIIFIVSHRAAIKNYANKIIDFSDFTTTSKNVEQHLQGNETL